MTSKSRPMYSHQIEWATNESWMGRGHKSNNKDEQILFDAQKEE